MNNMTNTNETITYFTAGDLLLTSESSHDVKVILSPHLNDQEAISLWGKAVSFLPLNMQYCKAQMQETKVLIQDSK